MGHASSQSTPYNHHAGNYVEGTVGTGVFYCWVSGLDTKTYSDYESGGVGCSASLGHFFNPYVAVEGGFMQGYMTGKTENGDSGRVTGTLTMPYLAARFEVPIGQRFGLIAKVGLSPVWASVTPSDKDDGESGSTSKYIFPFIGLGMNYALTQNIDFDVQYQAFNYLVVGAGLLSGGLTYHFS